MALYKELEALEQQGPIMQLQCEAERLGHTWGVPGMIPHSKVEVSLSTDNGKSHTPQLELVVCTLSSSSSMFGPVRDSSLSDSVTCLQKELRHALFLPTCQR